jgi:thiol:disulfide interchange protein DsbC
MQIHFREAPMRIRRLSIVFFVFALLIDPAGAQAFRKTDGPPEECRDCHRLTREEAEKLLVGGGIDNVSSVETSEIKGLWEVIVVRGGKKFPVYVDFTKSFLFNGQIIRLSTKENLTGARYESLNASTADPSKIPLGDTLVIGNPSARLKVIVFSDPECHFCGRLHVELKGAAAKDPDVAFFIKLYSRNNSPPVMQKARAIICNKSLAMLEDAYEMKPVPPPLCTTRAPEENHSLTEKLGIRGTPTMLLPDGRLIAGYKDAATILKLLAAPPASGKETKRPKEGRK